MRTPAGFSVVRITSIYPFPGRSPDCALGAFPCVELPRIYQRVEKRALERRENGTGSIKASLIPAAGGCTVMMGTKIRNFAPLPREVSLEELVPKDNFYRRLEATLDLSFVRDLVSDCYASSGRPSVDPVVFFRLQLVMFFEGIRSERQLMEVGADRLSVRWFLGYDLNEPLPDHSSLTRIRERYGLQTFRRYFERIVEECVEAGLVWGKELYFDATKVEANASLDSMRSRSLMEHGLEEHLAGIFPEEAQPVEGANTPEPTAVGPAGQEGQALSEANARQHRWIA